jgi:hypothetical protein
MRAELRAYLIWFPTLRTETTTRLWVVGYLRSSHLIHAFRRNGPYQGYDPTDHRPPQKKIDQQNRWDIGLLPCDRYDRGQEIRDE